MQAWHCVHSCVGWLSARLPATFDLSSTSLRHLFYLSPCTQGTFLSLFCHFRVPVPSLFRHSLVPASLPLRSSFVPQSALPTRTLAPSFTHHRSALRPANHLAGFAFLLVARDSSNKFGLSSHSCVGPPPACSATAPGFFSPFALVLAATAAPQSSRPTGLGSSGFALARPSLPP